LNLDQGGPIAAALDELYGYVQGRLLQAAIDNSTGPLDDARRVLDTLRDSWSTLATRGGTGDPAAADVEGAA
jgi:flagellin-specific chaperone FliS